MGAMSELGTRWRPRASHAARQAISLPGMAVAVAAVTLALGTSGDPLAIRVGLVALALAPWLLMLGRDVPHWVPAITLLPSAVLFWRGDQFAAMSVLLLVISLAATGRRLEIALGVAAGLAIVVPPNALRHDAGWVYWAGGLGVSVYGGWAYHVQRRLQEELFEARVELAHQALLEQRQHIARDVHDLVAHSLTVVMLHPTAPRLPPGRDPRAARATLARSERPGPRAPRDVPR